MESAREKGLKLFCEMYGDDMAEGVAARAELGGDFGSEQSAWTLDFAYGTVWAREGMDRKLRSCVILGMLIAQRQHDEIKFHTLTALKNGVTKQELEEIIYTAIPYAGFPAANSGKQAMLEAFAEMEAEG